MTRLGLALAATLGMASLTAPAPVAAQNAASVTGAAEAALPDGATFNGISLKGLVLGLGVSITGGKGPVPRGAPRHLTPRVAAGGDRRRGGSQWVGR
jgi:hypothetical protein